MKIRYRLTLYFTLIVAGILLAFSVSIYIFYLQHRDNDFQNRLRNKAINTVALLNTEPFDIKLLKIIDHTSVTNMDELVIIVLDSAGNFLYSNRDNAVVTQYMPVFRQLNWESNNSINQKGKIFLSFPYQFQNQHYILLASARDLYGQKELNKLLTIIAIVFIFSLILIVVAGFFNARQSLTPIKDIIRQVEAIKGAELNVVLQTRNKDEIAELANTFNNLLIRIRQAFDREKFFVSNASHELRTPITSIKGQIEVALMKRDEKNYPNVLQSVLDDTENMSQIINGLLELAEASADPSTISFKGLRIDELLFAIKDDTLTRNPSYQIDIEYKTPPMLEKEITVCGNYGLLWILFSNLIDNACKFSEDHTSAITIDFNETQAIIFVSDNGMGIPKESLEFITQPMYRAHNAQKVKGHGLGLSIVQRIAEVHKASLNIDSEINKGTSITVFFNKNQETCL